MSVEHLADILSEKTRSSSWVVVFKALVTVHHLMVHGNEVSTPGMHVVNQSTVSSGSQNILGLSRLIILYFVTSGGSE